MASYEKYQKSNKTVNRIRQEPKHSLHRNDIYGSGRHYNGYSSCSCRSSNTRYSSIGHAYGYNYCNQYEFRN